MNKGTIIKIIIILLLLVVLGILIYFYIKDDNSSNTNSNNLQSQMNEDKPDGKGPGENSNTNIDYTGATTITEDADYSKQIFESTNDNENALLIKNGTTNLTEVNVNKTGDNYDEDSDCYGTNAAILAIDDSVLNIKNSTVTTSGSHANAIFSYGKSTINVEDTTINTTKNNSGGIMVTGGGTINAKNLTITTEGNSSAAIRSDRGGGTENVDGGTYTTNGIGSPVIYSTADVTVENAELVANKSEGAIVEGKNSITLKNVKLTDSNTMLNGQSQTYKNIFLYQSMSGDADEGTAKFTAEDSTITTNKGDTIYVTNTTAYIKLKNNKIINNDGDFLRIEAAAWGKAGQNGGDVTLDLENQYIEGNIIVDGYSTLTMNLTSGSIFKGIIDDNFEAKNISLKLSKDSKLVLTGDCHVSSLEDEDSTYSNIDFNGYSLVVNGECIN